MIFSIVMTFLFHLEISVFHEHLCNKNKYSTSEFLSIILYRRHSNVCEIKIFWMYNNCSPLFCYNVCFQLSHFMTFRNLPWMTLIYYTKAWLLCNSKKTWKLYTVTVKMIQNDEIKCHIIETRVFPEHVLRNW
jgi:hypothetical protein